MSPSKALLKFHKEYTQLLRASIYLLQAHLEAKSGDSEMAEKHDSFQKLLTPDYANPHDYFVARLFISHISAFELLLQELAAFVIRKHPKKVGKTSFTLTDVLEASGSEGLVQRAIEEHLNKLMYKKPLEYLDDLADLLSIDPAPLKVNWKSFIEAKARRDLGVHNGWKCNAVYQRKLTEAGFDDVPKVGVNLIPKGDDYLNQALDEILALAEQITRAVEQKHEAPSSRMNGLQ